MAKLHVHDGFKIVGEISMITELNALMLRNKGF